MYVHLPPLPHPFTQHPHHPPKKIGQIRILCQFIEKYLPLKKMGSLSNKFTKPPAPPPLPPLAQTTHLPHPAHFFFSFGLFASVSEFFYKLTKNPNIKKIFFFSGGGGGGAWLWRGGCEHNVQTLEMALLLFKDYKCAKLF